jgi:GH24 family phage-related lysozyme (muramidase)
MLRLIPNARRIAARAHSMWAFYLSLLCLVAPDALYLLRGVDTSPRLWWIAGVGLLIYGIVGRLTDQGIDRTKARNPAWIAVAALVLVAVVAGRDLMLPAPGPTAAPPPAASIAGAPTTAQTMAIAVPFVARWEGLRTDAYRDPVGVVTICYGSTRGIRMGMSMMEAECDALLRAELIEYREGLHRYLTAETLRARLTPERDTAYTSLAFNVGIAGAGGSTATRRLNAGDIAGGCEAITWWNKAGGRVLRGLVARRAEERDLCMIGVRA